MTEANVKAKKGSKQAQLDAIAAQVAVCTLCRLSQSRTHAVPGAGSAEAEIMIIGEGPGWHEDREALPFVGPSGQLLDKLLASIGIRREDVFITNVVKCRPPNNRDPLPDEADTCRRYLDAQIAIIQPRMVITLGRYSMSLFFPNAKITQVHGQPRTDPTTGVTYVPMFHPAAALRAPAWMEALQADFKRLPEILANPPAPTAASDAPPPAPEPAAMPPAAAEPSPVQPTTAEATIASEPLAKPKAKRTRPPEAIASPPTDERQEVGDEGGINHAPTGVAVARQELGSSLAPPTQTSNLKPQTSDKDEAWEELTGAVEASRAEPPKRGRPRKVEPIAPLPPPPPNQQPEQEPPADKPRTKREKEEDAGQLSFF